jgi:FMN-dependent NADH-azoreductase
MFAVGYFRVLFLKDNLRINIFLKYTKNNLDINNTKLKGEILMSKVLYIKANPKPDSESNTFKLSNVFLEEYKKSNPNDEIVTLDLYKENIQPLNQKGLHDMFSGGNGEAYNHANLFASADKYIIAAPMWNLSIPSILKSYIDYVCYAGISFKYTAQGSVGLLENKKAIHIVSRGGAYNEPPGSEYEMGDRYLRTILGFMGVKDVQTLALDLTNVLQGEQLEEAREKSNEEARKIAKEF